ncbi:MAG: hypothetical protein KC438_07085 [Thermomicrobiales bacterium]|nr:hypothetical protein [Thermomicrobiales bacterium]MCO5223305.1 hypothetical protein [Thermomicrobiales bacterium]
MANFTVHATDGDFGIWAESDHNEGLHGVSSSMDRAAIAAFQINTDPAATGNGIYAESWGGGSAIAAFIRDDASKAVAIFAQNDGASADSHAIKAFQAHPDSDAAALHAEHATGKTAGFFRGNIIVTGDISFPGQDCAEEFAAEASVEATPGTVMSLTDSGRIAPSAHAYERRVVGIVTGAGPLRPGIVMGRHTGRTDASFPIALMGTVYCRADTSNGPIEVGDLLTTSVTPGHAMKATDPMRAFGAVIGKAMGSLERGAGLLPVIVALQ